jgi:hypothetical protein
MSLGHTTYTQKITDTETILIKVRKQTMTMLQMKQTKMTIQNLLFHRTPHKRNANIASVGRASQMNKTNKCHNKTQQTMCIPLSLLCKLFPHVSHVGKPTRIGKAMAKFRFEEGTLQKVLDNATPPWSME